MGGGGGKFKKIIKDSIFAGKRVQERCQRKLRFKFGMEVGGGFCGKFEPSPFEEGKGVLRNTHRAQRLAGEFLLEAESALICRIFVFSTG